MIVWALSSSRYERKVGSSFVNRLSAFEKLAVALLSFGEIASLITASGTCIDVIVYFTLPSVKVSPEAHSTPNSATMSPAVAESMSCISFECMRTSRGTFTFLSWLEMLKMKSPLRTVPW